MDTTLCAQCHHVSAPPITEGTLVLANLDDASRLALVSSLEPYGIAPSPIAEGVWSFVLFEGCVEIIREWARMASEKALADAAFIQLPTGENLGFAHMGRMRPLTDLVKRLKNAWVLEVIRNNRLTVHYHPIVEAADPDTIFAHECLMRGVDESGGVFPPARILDAADEEGLVFHLDRIARVNAIHGFAAQGVEGKAFINFNPVSVYNPLACLRTTVAAAKESGLTPDRIVFELIERNHVADEAHLLRIVDFYRAAGYGVALDDVGAGYSGLNLLSTLMPDYIKLDMHLIRNVDTDPIKQSIVGNLLEMARKLGVRTVVEGVETEAEYRFARQEGADFVQGYLFAKPAARALAGFSPLRAAA